MLFMKHCSVYLTATLLSNLTISTTFAQPKLVINFTNAACIY